MSTPIFKVYPGFGEWASENLNYSQTVRIGNVIHISGQGGWDPSDPNIKLAGPSLREEIEQGFKNVEMVLRNAGAQGWEDVYKMHSYHAKWEGDVAGGSVEEGPTKIMADMLQKYGKGVKPVWTEIGVARLGLEAMRIEIEVEAYVKN